MGKAMKLRAALVVDNLKISKWQRAALDFADESIELVMLLNCQNTQNKKKYFKNFLYYFLNLLSLRSHLTKKEKVVPKATLHVVNFDAIYDGNWQSFPSSVCQSITNEKIDVVIKFGMNLLRIDECRLSVPILSFHHGDPSKYRGRPAGFYEVLNGEKTTGIVVQRLSNELDAGEILAFASSKVVNYSYKKTAVNFYSNSAYLLQKAVTNLSSNKCIKCRVDGENYRLPSNSKVVRLSLLLLRNKFIRLFYGAFLEKRWHVAISPNNLSLKGDECISSTDFLEIPISKKYNFYADAFFSEDGKSIRLEALDNKTGLGDILEIDLNNLSKQKLLLTGHHFSYPFSFTYQNEEYLLPEVASHSSQYICAADKPQTHITQLKGLEGKRIVDATLMARHNMYFLFFGESTNAHTVLNLWFSASPFSEFKPHPMSPIAVSPNNARMGGKLLADSNRIIRFGQNNSGEYGESLSVIEIMKISDEVYEEKQVGTLCIDELKGPHSIGFSSDMSEILIDYYYHQFSLFSGVRRIKAKFKSHNQAKVNLS